MPVVLSQLDKLCYFFYKSKFIFSFFLSRLLVLKKKSSANGDGQSNTAGSKLMNLQCLGHKQEKTKNLPTERPTTWFVRAKGVWDPALGGLFRHRNISVDLFLLFNKRTRGQSNYSITHTHKHVRISSETISRKKKGNRVN